MTNRFIADTAGLFTCELEVNGLVLHQALEHKDAEDLLRCALIVALSALVQDAPWPDLAMDSFASFMVEMRDRLVACNRC
jgi:hypothetical protein